MNLKEARKWLKMASDNGDSEAAEHLDRLNEA